MPPTDAYTGWFEGFDGVAKGGAVQDAALELFSNGDKSVEDDRTMAELTTGLVMRARALALERNNHSRRWGRGKVSPLCVGTDVLRMDYVGEFDDSRDSQVKSRAVNAILSHVEHERLGVSVFDYGHRPPELDAAILAQGYLALHSPIMERYLGKDMLEFPGSLISQYWDMKIDVREILAEVGLDVTDLSLTEDKMKRMSYAYVVLMIAYDKAIKDGYLVSTEECLEKYNMRFGIKVS